jgi:hypothetical protein
VKRRLALESLLVLALAALAVYAHVRWVRLYHEPPQADYAVHVSEAAGFASVMAGQGHFTEKVAAAWGWPGLYADGVYATTWLLRPFTDAGSLGALESLAFYWVLAVIGAYLLGRAGGGPAVGALAAVLVMCDVRLLHTSRRYWLDMPLGAMLLVSLAALVYSDGFRRPLASLAVGLSVGWCLLVKFTAVWFLPLPFVAALGWGAWRERPRRRAVLRFVVAGAIVGGGLAALGAWSQGQGPYVILARDLTPPLSFQLIFGAAALALLWATFAWFALDGVLANTTYALAIAVAMAAPWGLVNRFLIGERWRATALEESGFRAHFFDNLFYLNLTLPYFLIPCILGGIVAAAFWRRTSLGFVLLAVLSGATITFAVLGGADRYLAPITALCAVLAVGVVPARGWIAWPLFVVSLVIPYFLLFAPPVGRTPNEDVVNHWFAGTMALVRQDDLRDLEPLARAIDSAGPSARSFAVVSHPSAPADRANTLYYMLCSVEAGRAAPRPVRDYALGPDGMPNAMELLPLEDVRVRTLAIWRGEEPGPGTSPPEVVALSAPATDAEAMVSRAFARSYTRLPIDDPDFIVLRGR